MSKTPSQTRYAGKLKDPRWQKKRLEILEDRGWACEACFDTQSTLNVHHKAYEKGLEPWDYEPHVYTVLCDECHQEEHSSVDTILKGLCGVIKKTFLSSQIVDISVGFNEIKIVHTDEVVASAIGWAISDESMVGDIVSGYLKSIRVANES